VARTIFKIRVSLMCRKIKIGIMALFCFSPSIFATGETRVWDFAAGFGGTETINTGSAIDTFYWGAFVRAGYQIADPLKARLAIRHTRNKFLYDGLGGIAKQSHTAFSPGISWDLSEKLSFDAEYNYRLGENSFQEHAGTLAAEYLPFSFMRFSVDGSYSQQNYIFPDSGVKVSQRSINLTLEPAILLSKQIEFPVLLSYLNSRYTTNKTIYVATTAAPGFTFRSHDRLFHIRRRIAIAVERPGTSFHPRERWPDAV
jgi:hypothetical protein